jgi:hypothetical protein
MYTRSNFSWAGIAIQSAKGTPATVDTALPLAGAESLERNWDMQYSEVPDGMIWDVWSVKRGEWAQGDLPVYFHPDLLEPLDGILQLGADGQPPYVTAVVGIGNRYTKQVVDARVTSARFSFSRRDLPQVTLSLLGRFANIQPTVPPSVIALTNPPFTRQETLVYCEITSSGVTDIPDSDFSDTHWANFYIQSAEVTVDFNPIDAGELIPFGDIYPVDVLTTVVRVTGNLTIYLPNPTRPEVNQLLQGSHFALGILLRRGTKQAKLIIRRACPERVPVAASGDKTSLEQFTIDFRALAPIIDGTLYPAFDLSVVP